MCSVKSYVTFETSFYTVIFLNIVACEQIILERQSFIDKDIALNNARDPSHTTSLGNTFDKILNSLSQTVIKLVSCLDEIICHNGTYLLSYKKSN